MEVAYLLQAGPGQGEGVFSPTLGASGATQAGPWQNSPGLIAAAAALVLLLALGAWLILKRRRRQGAGEVARVENPPATADAAPLEIAVGNLHNIGARESQQDSFGVSDLSNQALRRRSGVLAVVADGMGGLADGAQVSARVTASLLRAFAGASFDDASRALLEMVREANSEINRCLGGRPASGSTLVAAILKGDALHFISVGDSRICLVRGGALVQLNRDHNYLSELLEQAVRGEITFEQALCDPQKNALTSYIGMGEMKYIDRSVRPLRLRKGDRVLLMSDGVYGALSEEELVRDALLPAVEAAAQIEADILLKNRPAQDNFTAIVIECL